MPIGFEAGGVSLTVEGVPEHGIATIWGADVLIWGGQPHRAGARSWHACEGPHRVVHEALEFFEVRTK